MISRHLYLRLAALSSLALLLAAFWFQYVQGLAPCTLCYWQRIPHGVVIALGFLTFLPFARSIVAAIPWLMMASFFVGSGLGFWHSGVELGILPGPSACSGGLVDLGGSASSALDNLLSGGVVRCDAVVWSFLGLSMATWNGVLSFCLGCAILVFSRKGATK